MNNNIGSPLTVHETYSHGLIFSSDTTNACYQLSSNPITSITMSSRSTGSGGNNFITISDIIISTDTTSVLSNLVHEITTRVSWCNEFSNPESTQTTSTINFNLGTASTFAI